MFLTMIRLILMFFLFNSQLSGQAFKEEIIAFKKIDSIQTAPTAPILFIGSSSFTNWKNMQECFPRHPILNRGFGGSSLLDLSYYLDDIAIPYDPKQVIIYCGENDFAGDESLDSKTVFNRFITVYSNLRKALPKTTICYISMKPSPSRILLIPKFIECNAMIQNFLSMETNACYIDVFYAMLDTEGSPQKSIFLEDMLHMKAEGYEIWKALITPYLLK